MKKKSINNIKAFKKIKREESKKKIKKAQIALEYIIVLSFFILLTLPAFYYAYGEITYRENYYKLDKALKQIGNKADFLCSLDEGSKAYLDIDFPKNTEYISFNNTYIIIKTTRQGEASYKTRCKVIGNITVVRGLNALVLKRIKDAVIVSISENVSLPPQPSDKPIIIFVPPTPSNASSVNVDWVFVNTTITDSDGISLALLEWNETNESMLGSGSNWYKNKTGLSNGVYIYKVYAYDTLGNYNATKTRYVYVNVTRIVCKEFNATLASGTATNPSNALISDNAYAILPSNGIYVEVSNFNLSNAGNKGNIISVEVAMEYHREGSYNNDNIELSYYINGVRRNKKKYNDAATDTKVYFNVTNDRAWTWQDIDGLSIRATFKKKKGEDAIDWYVDSLWTRICYYTW